MKIAFSKTFYLLWGLKYADMLVLYLFNRIKTILTKDPKHFVKKLFYHVKNWVGLIASWFHGKLISWQVDLMASCPQALPSPQHFYISSGRGESLRTKLAIGYILEDLGSAITCELHKFSFTLAFLFCVSILCGEEDFQPYSDVNIRTFTVQYAIYCTFKERWEANIDSRIAS